MYVESPYIFCSNGHVTFWRLSKIF